MTAVLCECYPLLDGQQTGSMNQHAQGILNKDQFSRCVYFVDPQKLLCHSQGRVTNTDDLAETEVTQRIRNQMETLKSLQYVTANLSTA